MVAATFFSELAGAENPIVVTPNLLLAPA